MKKNHVIALVAGTSAAVVVLGAGVCLLYKKILKRRLQEQALRHGIMHGTFDTDEDFEDYGDCEDDDYNDYDKFLDDLCGDGVLYNFDEGEREGAVR